MRFLILLCYLMCSLSLQAAPSVPYLHPLIGDAEVKPLLTVGEAAGNGYRLAGGPDGLGARDNGDGTLTVLMNHEIPADKGVPRAHGGKGAFVSRWTIRLADLAVLRGEDLVRQVQLWDAVSASHNVVPAVAFGRFCSADLAADPAFTGSEGEGFDGRLLLNGEEEKDAGGRAFAHVVGGAQAGVSYELPHLGRVAWENLLALPQSGHRTVVVGMDDYPGGHVYVYVGEKRRTGNPVEKAGLVGGALYAVRFEDRRFSLLPLGEVVGLDGKVLRARARQLGATPLLRPEDGAWDKRDRNVFWFATTDRIDGKSQLFRLAFDDSQHPEQGGHVDEVLEAGEVGAQMFDNLAVDGDGRVLIEEDPGESDRLAAIWLYDPARPHTAQKLFESESRLFTNGGAEFMTEDEEHSGIIEVTGLLKSAPWAKPDRRYFFGVTQAHTPQQDAELVEGGQLWLIAIPAASVRSP
ncbi:MAG TPA: DUF839 domain-containing protein [Methylophilaceae bacterium]|nr:DUF839 domain-containing protein [Methylophilaceae bacterium]